MLGRKFVWLMILMVWVGMVTSIIIYQGNEYVNLQETTSNKVNIIPSDEMVVEDTPEDINYTQAQDEEDSDENFFTEYRLERDKARSEQISIYREMVNNPNTDEAIKKDAQQKMMDLTEKMEKEMEIESLIRARGYKDAIAYIHDGAVDVIIQTGGLSRDDVAKIGDIIVKTTGFDFKDVTIIEKKNRDNQQ
ncbi:SpoIIIAH-like family protein [Halothermothrix orenii]|uniref:Stage III sporulation protein AH n=1 Tax=Halothermothrix orenii (strain H 168 / OCM 544 / DSM 9562) TaxID=373903 RepID=B8D2F4_HALOH|nr:SpoIIIAH-like family protein [Halothermothrix orenii]ACL69381.1 hypothetical protein Hore_06240 [Halothermothrix orenii H 168]